MRRDARHRLHHRSYTRRVRIARSPRIRRTHARSVKSCQRVRIVPAELRCQVARARARHVHSTSARNARIPGIDVPRKIPALLAKEGSATIDFVPYDSRDARNRFPRRDIRYSARYIGCARAFALSRMNLHIARSTRQRHPRVLRR